MLNIEVEKLLPFEGLKSIIFCGYEMYEFKFLRCVFLCIEAVTGMHIDLTKRELIPVGKANNIYIAEKDCGFAYNLGLPFGSAFKSNEYENVKK